MSCRYAHCGHGRRTDRTGLKVDTNGDAFNDLWTARPALPMGIIDVQDERYVGLSVSEKLSRVLELLAPGATPRLHIQRPGRNSLAAEFARQRCALQPRVRGLPRLLCRIASFCAHDAPRNHHPWPACALSAEAGVSCVLYGSPLALIDRPKHYRLQHRALRFVPKAMYTPPRPWCSMRAEKNEAELQGFRDAMTHDGVAMVQFLHRLYEAMQHSSRR